MQLPIKTNMSEKTTFLQKKLKGSLGKTKYVEHISRNIFILATNNFFYFNDYLKTSINDGLGIR